MTNGAELRPIDKSEYSWRDHIRELMTLKYGRTGKSIAEGLIGESEEEKYMNWLLRKYSTYDLSKLPPKVRENIPTSRPMGDMLAVGRGGGMSDIGGVDAVLMAMAPTSWPAALTESGLLGADAVGEYRKGNTIAASIMGAVAGVPPLMRYGFGKTTSKADRVLQDKTLGTSPYRRIKDPFHLENLKLDASRIDALPIDEQRRLVLKGIGSLGVMAGSGAGALKLLSEPTAVTTAARTAAKVMPKVAPIPFVDSIFSIMSGASKTIGEALDFSKFKDNKVFKLNFEPDVRRPTDLLGSETEFEEAMSAFDYPLSDIFYQANEFVTSTGRQIPKTEFNKILDDVIDENTATYVGKFKEGGPEFKAIGRSKEFKDTAYEYYIKNSDVIRNYDIGKKITAVSDKIKVLKDRVAKSSDLHDPDFFESRSLLDEATQEFYDLSDELVDAAGNRGYSTSFRHRPPRSEIELERSTVNNPWGKRTK